LHQLHKRRLLWWRFVGILASFGSFGPFASFGIFGILAAFGVLASFGSFGAFGSFYNSFRSRSQLGGGLTPSAGECGHIVT
jgi:hypothetical protein